MALLILFSMTKQRLVSFIHAIFSDAAQQVFMGVFSSTVSTPSNNISGIGCSPAKHPMRQKIAASCKHVASCTFPWTFSDITECAHFLWCITSLSSNWTFSINNLCHNRGSASVCRVNLYKKLLRFRVLSSLLWLCGCYTSTCSFLVL